MYMICNRLAVDRVCLYENMEAELETIRQTLGLPNRIEVPHTKSYSRKDRRPYQEIIGQEEREIVARACAREIALFGYTFD
jgi:hypothetical protein